MWQFFIRRRRLYNVIFLIIFFVYTIKLLTLVSSLLDVKLSNSVKLFLPIRKGYFVPTSLKKIDWHDYKQIESEKSRVGIGEHGYPANLSSNEAENEKYLYSVNGFNGALSDKISYNRSLPDIRHFGCRKKWYIESLPKVSVIVAFHDEHWSTLLRTVYSVINRSPPNLIKEFFLVDDASTKSFLKQFLVQYLSMSLPEVKVLRLKSRKGLVAARLMAAKQATADVLVVLDSHTEVNVNWLPPLLEPIALNYRTVVCPTLDVIAYDTFEYYQQDEGARGAFDWELNYKRLPILPKDRRNLPEPFENPVMPGGLFAISREFFWELDGYDPGLDILGGDQFELSFKIWQCGGRILDAPCSRVGHVFRKFSALPDPGHGFFLTRNLKRVAEVWMDEYASFVYKRRPDFKKADAGDISEQKALRQKLKCKPFRWYMTQVAFDIVKKYPPVEPNPFARGKIRPVTNLQYCVDGYFGGLNDTLQLKLCNNMADAEQDFILTWHKDIRSKVRDVCWVLANTTPRSPIFMDHCQYRGGNQLWRYRPNSRQLNQGKNCLEWDPDTRDLFINRCRYSEYQEWIVENVDEDMIAKWDFWWPF